MLAKRQQILANFAAIAVFAGLIFPALADEPQTDNNPVNWQAFELADLAKQRDESGGAYLRFLKVPSLSTGLYQLSVGSTDLQRPHDRDEIYYVTAGQARFEVDGEQMNVQSGSILYVKAGVEHRFHSIEQDLTVLVIFAAAE